LRSFAIAILLLCGLAGIALADPDATGSDAGSAAPETAESLFNEGRSLAAAGNFAAACERFERAVALDPGALGTALNLADCYEKRALTAKAYRLFTRVAHDAEVARDDGKATYARDRAGKLVVQLVAVDVHVPARLLSSVAVAIDREPVATVAPVIHELVDPGMVVVDATAPGELPFHDEHRAGAGDTVTVELVLGPPPIEPLPPGAGVATRRRSWVLASIIGGGIGLVGVGVGLGFGDAARSDHDRVLDDGSCRATPHGLACTPAGASAEAHAGRLADVATGLTIGGAAVVAAAAVVWALAPRDHLHGYAVAPIVTGSEIGVVLDRAF
jgi:hypothetical protein